MTFFPEPIVDDPSWARRGEGTFEWLRRSTNARARGYRQFLNRNLGALPKEAAQQIFTRMRAADFDRAAFEMIVGRTLQLLGAALTHEPATPAGRRPDWRATFSDGEVVVECTCPEFNLQAASKSKVLEPLVALVEKLAPEDWSVALWDLPEIGPQESRGQLRSFLEREFARVPPAATQTVPWAIEGWIAAGRIALQLLPKRISETKVVAGPGIGWWGDDTATRIRDAVRTKRGQVRATGMPTVLAVSGGAWATFEAFDLGLLGQGPGSELTGDPAFVLHRASPPTVASVLAYSRPGPVADGPDPVLYKHPRYAGRFPAALDSLEIRTTWDGRGLIRYPSARKERLLAALSAGIEIA